ncbi:hypothetical protein HN51_058936 [Arachis hypogaea]
MLERVQTSNVIYKRVAEQWGSLGDLTASIASNAAAPARAHLRAIRSRQRGETEEKSVLFLCFLNWDFDASCLLRCESHELLCMWNLRIFTR